MLIYPPETGTHEQVASRNTIPPAIHLAGILLLIMVTAVCGPFSTIFP